MKMSVRGTVTVTMIVPSTITDNDSKDNNNSENNSDGDMNNADE